jgi:isochorismate hydrolase
MMKAQSSLLDRNRAGLLVIDIQEKLLAVMSEPKRVVENTVKLIQGFQRLDLPIHVTEQYPQGIGPTVLEILNALDQIVPQQKLSFSCCGIEHFIQSLQSQKRDQWILCGIETHVCVWQTSVDLLEHGFQIHVVSDAVSSRNPSESQLALDRMRMRGIQVTSTEMVLFELLRTVDTPEFKDIHKLIKSRVSG